MIAPVLPMPGAARARVVRDVVTAPDLGIRWSPALLGLFVVTVISVSRIHQHFAIVALLRPALVSLGVVVVWAFLVPGTFRWRNMLDYWPGRTLVALAVVACLSIAFGISMGNSAQFFLDLYSRSLLQATLIAVAIRLARDLYAMIWGYVVGAGLLSYLSLFVFRTNDYNGVERLGQLYAYDANDAGLVLLVAVPLTLLLIRVARGAARALAILILLGIGAAIARTGSRGAFVGLAVVGVTLLFTMPGLSVARKLAFVAATVVALAFAAPSGYWRQMGTVLSPSVDYNWSSVDGRKQLAMRGLGYMLEYPVFGIGVGNFERAECTISTKAQRHLRGTGLRCFAPHNSHVQAGAELGLPGLVLWLGLLAGGVFGMRRLGRRIPRYWASGTREQRFLFHAPAALSLAMLGFAIGATFLSFAWLEIVYIVTAFIIGTYASVAAVVRREWLRAAYVDDDGSLPSSRYP